MATYSIGSYIDLPEARRFLSAYEPTVKMAKFDASMCRAPPGCGGGAGLLMCSMLEPYSLHLPKTRQPQAAAQLERAGQREPLPISFYTEVLHGFTLYVTAYKLYNVPLYLVRLPYRVKL